MLVAIIHYQTPDLIADAARSFRTCYPDVAVRIVDNGSADGSADEVGGLCDELGIEFERLPTNIYHGPAMHHVLASTDEQAVFFLDSDTVTRKPGFLEPMRELLADPTVFAVGRAVNVNRRGFADRRGTPVPQSAYMLVDRGLYETLPPFIHHGLPVLGACRAASDRGLRIADFPVDEYVDHLGRGTAERFGYGLGLRSRLDFLLNRLGL